MSFLDPIFMPLLDINPLLAVFIISFTLSLAITLIYKYMTDQELMKTLKEDMKKLQKEMKELRNNPEKMLSVQKKAMEKNMKYMMHSMRSTLVTFIPILLIFGWLNANFGYYPILPGQEFTVDVTFNNNVYGYVEAIPPKINNSIILMETEPKKEINSKTISYKFKAMSYGEWDIIFKVNNQSEYKKRVLIDDKKYSSPTQNKFSGKDIKQITVGYQKKIVLDLFGLKLGWLGTYIIFSILFSLALRKILNVH